MTEAGDLRGRPEKNVRPLLQVVQDESQDLRGVDTPMPFSDLASRVNIDPGSMWITKTVGSFDQAVTGATETFRKGIKGSVQKGADVTVAGAEAIRKGVKATPEVAEYVREEVDAWGEKNVFSKLDNLQVGRGGAIVGAAVLTAGVGAELLFGHHSATAKEVPAATDIATETVAAAPVIQPKLGEFEQPSGFSNEQLYDTREGKRLIATVSTPPMTDGEVSVAIKGKGHKGSWQGQLGKESVGIPVDGCDVFVSRKGPDKYTLQTDC